MDSSPTTTLDGLVIRAGNANGSYGPDSEGSGVYCDGGSPVIDACTFLGNYSYHAGGGFLSYRGRPMLTNCLFRQNRAAYGAGLGCFENSHAMVTGCRFVGNLGVYAGAAYTYFGCNPRFESCVFEDNAVPGMDSFSEGVVVSNCRFSRNVAIYGSAGFDGEGALVNCTFSDNGHGGGARSSGGFVAIGCVFSGNETAGFTGAGALINCTLSENVGQGIVTTGNVTVTNCILWGNRDETGQTEAAQIPFRWTTIEHCCIQGLTGALGGVGTIGSDPLLVDADGPDDIAGTEDDDVRLRPGSPGIDAGDNAAVPVGVVTDLAGVLRFVDDPTVADTGAGTAPIVDMGAYEFQASPAADLDRDGDVDGTDVERLQNCWSGPAVALPEGCGPTDFDHDGDVDQGDFGILQRCFSGKDVAAHPGCG